MKAPLRTLLVALPLSLAAADQAKIDRGKYLVEEVARCQECHTPRNPDGALDQSKWLKGGDIYFQPVEGISIARWHKGVVNLTRSSRLWMRWGEGAIVKYLQTGLGPSGKPADPPMPAYKMKAEDAEAVVEYLKTLP